MFQGPDYEDPNPPEEDEATKKKKAKDPNAEPEIRMITPEPVEMQNESGREFELELGRYEQVPIVKNEEDKEGENTPAEANPEATNEEPQTEEKWVQYKFDQTKDDLVLKIATEKANILVADLEYALDEDTFKGGMYEIVIRDVTRGVPENERLEPTRLDFKVFDSEAEAEALANAQAQAKGGKKK